MVEPHSSDFRVVTLTPCINCWNDANFNNVSLWFQVVSGINTFITLDINGVSINVINLWFVQS